MHQSEGFRINSADEQLDNLQIMRREQLVHATGDITSNINFFACQAGIYLFDLHAFLTTPHTSKTAKTNRETITNLLPVLWRQLFL